MSAPIQRFNFECAGQYKGVYHADAHMEPNDTGRYMLYADHLRVVEAMKEKAHERRLKAAVLAERERCAKIAYGFAVAWQHGCPHTAIGCAETIAAALRHDPARGGR